jgi:hypothetical protein
MPSGLEADLPEGLAIEDIVRLLKGSSWTSQPHSTVSVQLEGVSKQKCPL